MRRRSDARWHRPLNSGTAPERSTILSLAAARTSIGDDGRSQRFIRTVHGRGLQFVGDVVVDAAASAPAKLTVASVGDGPPMVKAANWLTHAERDWNSPIWHHWMTELSARYSDIRYDSRGCGLSDHDLRGSSLSDLEVWTSDLETVVEQQGLDRFVLFGKSQGGAPAMAYAARHPDRVSHLVLLGCYSRGMRHRRPEASAQAQIYLDMMQVGWGGRNPAFRTFFTTTFLPSASSEQMRWFNELQNDTTSPENAMLLEQAFYDYDFTEACRSGERPHHRFPRDRRYGDAL